MKIVAISDTHGFHGSIEFSPEALAADVLVAAGDISGRGLKHEIIKFLQWFQVQPQPHKILVAGNHDFMFQTQPGLARALLREHAPGVTYLQDSGINIDGVRFWGSPWQPWFYDWAFNLPRGVELAKKWDLIPERTHVLVTHGPAYYTLDRTRAGAMVGCEELTKRITHLSDLKAHIFGHIHESYGQAVKGSFTSYNVAICTLGYSPTNPPTVLEVL